MEKKLALLVDKMRAALGDRLVAVILYGSGASGEHIEKFSDLNVLCVTTRVTPRELADAEPVVRWWLGEGNPSPLLLSREEVQGSADVFAIEFHDMLEQRRVLFGKDVIDGLVIEPTFYRAQVEHDLRSKLLRLRQKGAAVLSDNTALLTLMLDSVSTFCILLRHAMLLAGIAAATKKRDVVARLGEIGMDPAPFAKLLDLREGRTKPGDVTPTALFDSYLAQVNAAVEFVDQLAK